MKKEELKKKNSTKLISGKLVLVFVVGLIFGALIQFFFFQPFLDNSDSFKSKLAYCEASRELCDKEIAFKDSCLKSKGINPQEC
jgi:hypothetical protein